MVMMDVITSNNEEAISNWLWSCLCSR